MNPVNIVEGALRNIMRSHRNVSLVSAAALAGEAPEPTTREEMSHYLQIHKGAAERSSTGFVLGPEGYGRGAYWRILGRPGQDPSVVQDNRVRHARWVIRDCIRRFNKDLRREIMPALEMIRSAGRPEDAAIERAMEAFLVLLDAAEVTAETILPA